MKTVIVAAFAFLAGATVAARAQGVGYPYGVSPHVAQDLAAEEAEDLKAAQRGKVRAPKLDPVDPWAPSLMERQVKALERIARALEAKCACAGTAAKRELPELLPAPQVWVGPREAVK